ncbi:ABC transporter permease [Saliterribacillus persicus]|uniref:Transport permease protein n=1 Tax=Saliterribacillus persicus TaxID=930114 RepID=A0A368YBA1_9BACI|nr:ABC transporter permease [Saliterribacillus persicus]RCW77405.1 teichoic acid transport system permease protein [Saliterribacillus persicus]
MFKVVRQIINEQISHWDLILRMAKFDVKGKYEIHYLGSLWEYINPSIQIAIYWFVFGLGLRQGAPIGDIPFFLWMLMGLIPWFFISPTLLQGSNSVHSKVALVSKMNFPTSVLPTVKIVSNSYKFFTMMAILLIVLIAYGIYPSIYIIQLVYYVICLFAFLFAFTIMSSTLSTLVRDYQMFLQSTMRMLLYLSPILWDTSRLPIPALENILKLNPFFYIIQGIRDSLIGGKWFFEDPIYLVYFWMLTFAILFFGSKAHLRFRKNFMDYL